MSPYRDHVVKPMLSVKPAWLRLRHTRTILWRKSASTMPVPMDPSTQPQPSEATRGTAAKARDIAPCDCVSRLQEAAALLETQGANRYRVGAYRRAAATIAKLEPGAIEMMVEREGAAALDRLPHVGRGIAGAIVEMVRTGHWGMLERLRGTSDPVALFKAVPGLGRRLAERIHEELHVDTLEGLEHAAADGRLEHVPSVGPRRAALIRSNLDAMLVRKRMPGAGNAAPTLSLPQPPVRLLLTIDRMYRDLVHHGALPRIAPARYNLAGESWLPVWHHEREGWQWTVLFSNTALAHQLHRTGDWVLIYHYDSEQSEGQHTVVTETHGPLAGKRVVRGRETECRTL